MEVRFEAVLYTTTLPGRYLVELQVSGVRTGIAAYVWGHKRAQQVMQAFIDDGIELLNKHNKFELVLNQVRAMRREKAMAQVQVGDKVRLLVDIGSIKKGRVCRVVPVLTGPVHHHPGGPFHSVVHGFGLDVSVMPSAQAPSLYSPMGRISPSQKNASPWSRPQIFAFTARSACGVVQAIRKLRPLSLSGLATGTIWLFRNCG